MKRTARTVVMATLIGLIPMALGVCLRTRITRDNFCRLEVGMTPDEVTAIFGESPVPWEFDGSHRMEEIPLMWVGEGTAHIMFHEGRGLVSKCWTEAGFSSPTKASFARVKVGITEQEAEALVGRPPERWATSQDGLTFGYWRDIDGNGTISFNGGRVHQVFWHGQREEMGRTEFLLQPLSRQFISHERK